MIETVRCPVCKSQNPHLSVVCGACGSYLRETVRSLNLFETAWNLLETPFHTMQRILLSGQKNYVWLLQALFGCAYVSFVLWILRLGNQIDELVVLLMIVPLIGPFIGGLIINIIALGGKITLGERIVGFRDIRAIISYASIPVILSFLVIFPVRVGIFGMYLFTGDPSPMLLKPLIYSFIQIVDGILIGFSLYLAVTGMRAAGLSGWKTVVFAVVTGFILFAPVFLTIVFFKSPDGIV
jgi:hypothetical protein